MDRPLPEEFIRLRKPLLHKEWDAFIGSYQEKPSYGLRRNPLKDCGLLPFEMKQIPWTQDGFYVAPEEHPGKHPLHEAGVYYIQEPSAMSVVSLLDPQPGEIVCDLCAAPGGKSTQIAGYLQGQGLLVCNEIIPNRAKILSQNIERMGIANALTCNETPDRMASLFPLFFDRILVDAPCSGEGMFRKDETAISQWSPDNITLCAQRQRMILDLAAKILKPGGIMVYSTCTFAPEENEEMIAWFLSTHPDYVLEDWRETQLGEMVSSFPDNAGLCDGSPKYVHWDRIAALLAKETSPTILQDTVSSALTGTLRLWPHKLRGEGHFAARLRKIETPIPEITLTSKKKKGKNNLLEEAISRYESFQKDFLTPGATFFDTLPSRYERFGQELYQVPPQAPPLSGIKILRAGLHLGSCLKNRFEPSYALAKALSGDQAKQSYNCTTQEAMQYLKGETLSCHDDYRGWTLVCYQNHPLGWGKAQNGRLKNHFPKGLRWLN